MLQNNYPVPAKYDARKGSLRPQQHSTSITPIERSIRRKLIKVPRLLNVHQGIFSATSKMAPTNTSRGALLCQGRKSTSPSIPILCNSTSKSTISLTIVVVLGLTQLWFKDDTMALLKTSEPLQRLERLLAPGIPRGH